MVNECRLRKRSWLPKQSHLKNYRSCSTNEDRLNRTQLAALFKSLGQNIPDLHWRIVDIFTSGNRIIVRGEASERNKQLILLAWQTMNG
jgi:hypothetical protein